MGCMGGKPGPMRETPTEKAGEQCRQARDGCPQRATQTDPSTFRCEVLALARRFCLLVACAGWRYECPMCGGYFRRLLPYGRDVAVLIRQGRGASAARIEITTCAPSAAVPTASDWRFSTSPGRPRS